MKNQWRPSASLSSLQIRASLLQTIRTFFGNRHVLEVETPLLAHTSVTDPYIESIPAQVNAKGHPYYLQTSPEYAMKRLLANGSGAIFQICKAFRNEELGRYHNPEFTLLEWYRPNYNHHQLMDEVDELLRYLLATQPAERKSYAEIFQEYLQINPHTASITDLKKCAGKYNIFVVDEPKDTDAWLIILMSHVIESQLGKNHRPTFVYDFPASQAALAKLTSASDDIAERFEVYLNGMELANGFHELQDEQEQRRRFMHNLKTRQVLQLPMLPLDEYFLAALQHGLPDCAGVALGIDRLMMIATQSEHIADVISFDFSRI